MSAAPASPPVAPLLGVHAGDGPFEPPPRGDRRRLVRLVAWAVVLGAGALLAHRVTVWRATYSEAVARLDAVLDAQEAALRGIPLLTADETAQLRRSLNATHVRLGETLGTEPIPSRDDLDSVVAARGLVRLTSTDAYTVAPMRYGAPLMTPDGAAALDTLARRFQAALAASGKPAFRPIVTSVLRSDADQAALRRVNVNAATGRSSHAFGTTFDLTYRRFEAAEPARLPNPPEALPQPFRSLAHEALDARARSRLARMAVAYPARLEAVLGRTLIALEDEGVLVALREVRQPVFHVSAARRLARPEPE